MRIGFTRIGFSSNLTEDAHRSSTIEVSAAAALAGDPLGGSGCRFTPLQSIQGEPGHSAGRRKLGTVQYRHPQGLLA